MRWVLALFVSGLVSADTVRSDLGGFQQEFEGRVVRRDGNTATLETDWGSVLVDPGKAGTLEVEERRLPIHEHGERAAKLGAKDAEAWRAHAAWCTENGLPVRARQALRRVRALTGGDSPEEKPGQGAVLWESQDGALAAEDGIHLAPDFDSWKLLGEHPSHQAIFEARGLGARVFASCTTRPMEIPPGEIWALDLETGKFALEKELPEVGCLEIVRAGGKLYVPGTEPMQGYELGNVYVFDGKAWVQRRAIPHGLHVTGFARCAGWLWAGSGGGALGACLWRSDDEGATWELAAQRRDHGRVYGLFAWGDVLLAVLDFRTLAKWDGSKLVSAGAPPFDTLYPAFAPHGARLFVGTRTGGFLTDLRKWDRFDPATHFVDAVAAGPTLFAAADTGPRTGKPVEGSQAALGARTDTIGVVLRSEDGLDWKRVWKAPDGLAVTSVEVWGGRLFATTFGKARLYGTTEFVNAGTVRSKPLTLSVGPARLDIEAAVPKGTSVEVRVRCAATPAKLAAAVFAGPDGTAKTFYDIDRADLGKPHQVRGVFEVELTLRGSREASPVVRRVSFAGT